MSAANKRAVSRMQGIYPNKRPQLMKVTINGSCLCGLVRFTVNNQFSRFHLCHCTQCQKITGSAHASNLFTGVDNIQWLSGFECIKRFDHPERDFTKVFCAECGSGLPFITKSGKTLIVPAGCLDDEPNVGVNNNIFWLERAAWYDQALSAKHCSRFPE
jgi:hypothetical protein